MSSFWAFNYLFKLSFYQDGMIVQHTSLMALKNKNWVQQVWIYFVFSLKVKSIDTHL